MKIRIERLKKEHWEDVGRIYLEGVLTGNISTDNFIPSWEKWDAVYIRPGRYVAKVDENIVGWGALRPVPDALGNYSNIGEVSIYVDGEYKNAGVGQKIIGKIIDTVEDEETMWTLQTGVLPDDKKGISFFKENGFREVGRREKLCKVNGEWSDLMLLERSSRKIALH